PVSDIFAVVVPHRARWEYIHFEISDCDLSTIVGPMPLLRYFDLSVDNRVSLPIEILDAPQLRTTVLGRFGDAGVALPWAQLTCLTL
ncbi:hypothetical protein DFH06DRAFT_955813, partial [Mycena polygramma]